MNGKLRILRKISIMLLAVYLCLITMPVCVHAASTTVYASTLNDNAQWTAPEGDVVLMMDVDKSLKSIYKSKTGSLTINGTQTLTINNTNNNQSGLSNGIHVSYGDLIIDGPDINITTASQKVPIDTNYTNGIYARNVTISNSNVDIVAQCHPIYGWKVTINEDAQLNGVSNGGGSTALFCSKGLVVDGSVSITSSNYHGYAIYAPTIAFNKGYLYAKSDPEGMAVCATTENGFTFSDLTEMVKPETYFISTTSPYAICDSATNKAATEVEMYAAVPEKITITDQNGSTSIPVIDAGQEYQLSISTTPEHASKKVKWTASDETVGTVSSSGIFKALSRGSVEVSAESLADNTVIGTVTIKVREENDPTSINSILGPDGSSELHKMFVGSSYPLSVSVSPETASDDVIWTVANEEVASIDSNGVITGKKAGTTHVTAASPYDSEIKKSAVVHFVERHGLDFTGSEFSYSRTQYYFGYLDIDGIEYNNLGYLKLKNVDITSDDQAIIKLSPPQYARDTTVSFYGTNTITSTYQSDDGIPGRIISMRGSAGIRIDLYDGAVVNLIDQGFNNGIENTSGADIYLQTRDSAARTRLSVDVNNIGLKGSAVYLQSYTDAAMDVTVNAKTGVQGSVQNVTADNNLTINVQDYGITGYLDLGTECHAVVNAAGADSEDHGIGITGPVSSSGGNYADISSYAKITGSTQAIEYSNIQNSSWGQYLAVTTPSDYRKSETTVIDNNTGMPAKTLILEPVVLNVIDGSGTGNYETGQGVSVAAEERTGYSFNAWDVTNTNGWSINQYHKTNYANLFSSEADVNNPAVTITVPAGRTKMAAVYDLVKYNITYKLNGGTNNSANPSTYYVTSDDITLANPKRTRYAFLGWTDEENPYEPVKPYVIPKGSTGDKELTAWWQLESITVDCPETHFFTERDYGFTYKLDPAEFVDDPSVTWSSSDSTIATVSSDGIVSAKKPGTVTIAAYNAETDLSASKEITITDLYDFATDDTERGDLETDGFAWRKNNFDSTLTIKDLNLTRDNEYVIRIPNFAWIEFDGNNTLTSTYKSADGTPGNIILAGTDNDTSTVIQIFPKAHGMYQPGSTLTLQDNGYNNGISSSTAYIEPHKEYDSKYSKYYYPAGTMTINANAAGYYGRGSGDFFTGHDLDLTITAHDGIVGCIYANIWYSANLTVNAENYGIEATNNVYLRDTSHAYINAIAKNPDDAGIAVKTKNIKDNGMENLTGNDMCFFEGSTAALEFIPEEHPNYGMTQIVHPADYSIRDQYVFDNARNETAKKLILGGTRYSITYQLDGGSVDGYNPVMYSKYSDDLTLITPTKEGYEFAGWLENDSEEKQLEVTVLHTETENKTFTATWEPIQYTINYELNGGTAENNPASYTVEDEQIVLNNPEREHYEFAGWTSELNEEPVMNAVIPAGSTGNLTFKANWTPVEYTIAYDYAGGEAEGNPGFYNIETETFTLNIPVKTGYTFTGWTDGEGNKSESVTIETGSYGNRTYTASWTPTVYTITYILDGGTLSSPNPAEYTIESDDIVLRQPQKEGYEFAGWELDGNNVGLIATIAKGTYGDLVFTAVWNEIIVDPEFAYFDEITLSLLAGETRTLTVNVYPDNATDKTIAWTSADESIATVNANGVVTGISEGVTTITATPVKGDSDSCTVTVTQLVASFDSRGGSEVEPQYPLYKAALVEPEAPERHGYEFIGWYLGEERYDFNQPVETNLEIHAEWKPLEYVITYVLDGGTAENRTVYTIETETFTLTSPVKEGYKFLGWTGSNGDTPETEVTIVQGTTGELSYTANWEREPAYVQLSLTDISLSEGETKQLIATVMPTDAVNKAVTWTSSDEAVATVDDSGLVTAVSEGTAVITVETVNGKTDRCTVTVIKPVIPVKVIRVNPTALSLKAGKTGTLTATVLPNNATDKTVTWASSNTNVATVDSNGLVTGVAEGTATITAAAGDCTATCTVTVTDPINIESVSLALKEKIEARFYVHVPDDEVNTTDINLTFNGKTTTYHAADITPKTYNKKPCRIVSVDTFAKQMRDDITVTVTKTGTTDLKYLEYKDEDVTNGMIFKIEDYVKLVKEKSTDEKLIDLVNKMDNYGKYAQIQFSYNLDSFDKADDIPADYDDSRLEQYAAVNNNNGITGLEFSAVSLELESDSGVRVYYNLTGSDKIGTYTFKVDGKSATPVKKGSLYYVAVKGIPARLMHKPHTVVVTDKDGKTLSTEFSALTYSSRVVANENATESLKNLARSIDLYAEAALAYFGE